MLTGYILNFKVHIWYIVTHAFKQKAVLSQKTGIMDFVC